MPTITPHLFVNPTAGRGRAGRRLAGILALLQGADIRPVLHLSEGVGDLEARVADSLATGAQRILVVGGDGSIHEAANALLASGSDAALGIIPSGTGNDFAKATDTSLDWETATRLLADRLQNNGPLRHVDAGRINERYFVNGAGIGFDAEVTQIARSIRWRIGDLVYLVAIFRAMRRGVPSPQVQLNAGELSIDGPLTLVSIANGAWIGGMFHIAPMARNNDGRFEVVAVAPVTRRRILALIPKLIRGKHMDSAEIQHASVTSCTLSSEEALPSHLDGEVQARQNEFRIELLADALRLV